MTGAVVIAAGGTGGHFFPAEALAAELMRRGRQVVLMSDARSVGERSAVFAPCERHVIKGAGIAGRGVVRGMRAALGLVAGVFQARMILQRLQPAAVVGFGGYPCVAPVIASRLLAQRPRVVLHEQNAVLGRANRALSRFADALALSFPATTKLPAGIEAVCTGNPVRPAIAARRGEAKPASPRFNLLVLGGSLGARVFSTLIPDAISHLPEDALQRLQLTQQVRAEDLEQVRARYAQIGISPVLSSFFDDVAGLLVAADLVIARAGASTVAELAAVGRPAILVPLPGAIDDHQRANAVALAEAGGAWMMDQSGLFAQDLADFITRLMAEPESLAAVGAAAFGFARHEAVLHLADLVETSLTLPETAI